MVSDPFGPLTLSVPSTSVVSTPLGSETGIFPIRDMVSFSLVSALPDERQDFTTYTLLASGAIR